MTKNQKSWEENWKLISDRLDALILLKAQQLKEKAKGSRWKKKNEELAKIAEEAKQFVLLKRKGII